MRTPAPLLFRIALLCASAALAVVTVQACGSDPDCGPGNCTGCCDPAGVCLTGDSTQACGLNGSACTTCDAVSSCLSGVCLPPGQNVSDSGTGTDDAGTTDGGDEDAGITMDAGTDDAGTQDAGTQDAGTQDAGTQDAGTVDAGTSGPDGVHCGNTTCAPSQVCCVDFSSGSAVTSCAASCPTNQGTLDCDGPEDCGGATTHCCGSIEFGPGNFGSCPIIEVQATCASGCSPNFPFTCPSVATTAFCHTAADCAPYGSYNQCCTFTQSGVSATFCVDAFVASAGTCHP